MSGMNQHIPLWCQIWSLNPCTGQLTSQLSQAARCPRVVGTVERREYTKLHNNISQEENVDFFKILCAQWLLGIIMLSRTRQQALTYQVDGNGELRHIAKGLQRCLDNLVFEDFERLHKVKNLSHYAIIKSLEQIWQGLWTSPALWTTVFSVTLLVCHPITIRAFWTRAPVVEHPFLPGLWTWVELAAGEFLDARDWSSCSPKNVLKTAIRQQFGAVSVSSVDSREALGYLTLEEGFLGPFD